MPETLLALQQKIKDSTGPERKAFFIQYCDRLIHLRNTEDDFSEEEIGYKVVNLLFTLGLTNDPEYNDIFDIVTELEKPRITSYAQPIGHWDEKTADAIKLKEWNQFSAVLEKMRI